MDFQIEHFPAVVVQETMRRIKVILTLLLPVLGLAGASYGSADVPAEGTSLGYRTFLTAAAGRGDPKATRDVHPSGQALRNPGRRAGLSASPNGTPLPRLVSAVGLTELRLAAMTFRVTAAAPELVRGWQFRCRTACEPRAPSTAS